MDMILFNSPAIISAFSNHKNVHRDIFTLTKIKLSRLNILKMESAKVESESTTRRWPSWICKSLFLLDIMFVLGGIVPINLPKSPWKKYSVYFCCLVITCLHTANTIRILIVLEPEETFSLSWLLRSINIISYGTGTLFSILHKMKAGKIREYFDCVTNLENTFQVLPTDVKRKVRRALIISTVVFCIFGIFSVATNFYMLSNVGYNPLFVFLASPLPPNHRYAKTLGYIVSAYGPLLNAAWMAPMYLYVVMCYIICQGFNQVYKKFERLAEAKKIGNELEELRKHHETMCSMVEAADDAISCYVGICSAETILFVCIMLYTVAKTPEDLIIVSMMAFGLIYMMVNVLCLMIGGIFVNEKVNINLFSCQAAFLFKSYRFQIQKYTRFIIIS